MNNVGEKYLPIGTVVMLKGGSKRVMITGFCSMATEDQSKMYDYAGCMFPEGFLSSDQTALFNHDQIERVYHMGLIDEEEQKFKTSLKTLVAQMSGGAAAPQPVVQPQPVGQSQAVEPPVPPVGPGLPGFTGAQPVSVPQQTSNGYSFDANGNVIAAPQEQPTQPVQPTPMNIQFDENGTVVSA